MKITRIDIRPKEMKLAEPYTIAYETVDHAVNFFLRLETEAGVSGFGCAAPDEPVTGETSESVLQSMNDIVIPLLKGSDPLRRTVLLEKIKKNCPHNRPFELRSIWRYSTFWANLPANRSGNCWVDIDPE